MSRAFPPPSERQHWHWLQARWLLVPSVEVCQRYLADLVAFCGDRRRAAAMLGVSVLNVRHWSGGKRGMAMGTRRIIWLTWCILLHPDRLQTAFDLVTWGRFRPLEPGQPRKPIPMAPDSEDWCDWSI